MRRPDTHECFVGLVTVLALAVRLYAEPMVSDIDVAASMGLDVYGGSPWSAGYSAYLRALYWVFPRPLDAAIMSNVILGTLTVPALYRFVRIYTWSRAAALASAVALAVTPIHARFSASDSAYIGVTLCYFVALGFVASWGQTRRRWDLVRAFAWLALMGNLRLDAVVYSLAVAAIVLGVVRKWDRRVLAELAFGTAALALFWISPMVNLVGSATDVASTSRLSDLFYFDVFGTPFFSSDQSPTAFVALARLGVVLMILVPVLRGSWLSLGLPVPGGQPSPEEPRARRPLWLLLVAIVPLGLGYPWSDEYQLRYATLYRYFLPSLATWCVVVGVGLAYLSVPLRRWSVVRMAVIVGVLSATASPHVGFLKHMWTVQLEASFLASNLSRIEDGCTIVTRDTLNCDCTLREGGPLLSAQAGRSHRWLTASAHLQGDPWSDQESEGSCLVFYLGAGCAAGSDFPSPGRPRYVPRCTDIEERYELIPVATSLLPVRPYTWENYSLDPVPVGLYRLRERSTLDAEDRPPTTPASP